MSILKARARSVCPPPVINVTPLIDVLLVLLIIFMVIQPLKEAKLPVKGPERSTGIVEVSPETLMLTVADDMRLELNSKPIEVGELLPIVDGLDATASCRHKNAFHQGSADARLWTCRTADRPLEGRRRRHDGFGERPKLTREEGHGVQL